MSSESKLIFLFLLISAFSFSCINESEKIESKEYEILEINLNNISGIEYVPLIAPEDKYVGRVRKIVKQDSILGLYDRARNSLWTFTESGEYVNEVRIPTGRGPGEVEHLNDIILTSDLTVHALGAFKIVSYDLFGNFIDEIEFDFFIYKIAYDEEKGTIIGYASNNLNERLDNEHVGHNLFWIDDSGEIIKSAIPIAYGREHMGVNVPEKFPDYNDDLYFFPRLVDTVYTINNGEVASRYFIDFGEHSVTDKLFDLRYQYSQSKFEWSEFQRNEIFGENYVGLISEFYEADSHIYFSFNTGDRHSVIIDKSDNSYSVVKGKMENDIDYGPTTFYNFVLDNKLFTILYPHDIKEHLEFLENNEPAKLNSEKTKVLQKLSDTLQQTDNPVLKIASFK